MKEQEIKDIIKKHLKVKTEYSAPHNFSKGYIRTSIYWDNDLIDYSNQEIYQSFF